MRTRASVSLFTAAFLLARGQVVSQSANRPLQAILGLVESGDGSEVIQLGARQVRLGWNGFQDNAHGKFLALLCELESCSSCCERRARRLNLVRLRLPGGKPFHGLPGQLILEFAVAQCADF